MSEKMHGVENSPEKTVQRLGYKFLLKTWPDYRISSDVNNLPAEETEQRRISNQQTRELVQSELARLQNEFSEEERRQLLDEALDEQISSWRQVMAGKSEQEISESIGRIRERWAEAYPDSSEDSARGHV